MIIKPSSLGDVVHTLPAVALLRDAHPHAEISWVINREFAPLLRGNSDVNHVQVFPRREFRGLGATGNLFRWWRTTKLLRPDLALDFQGLLRSALIARISGARKIYGMSDGREGSRWFYHRVARVDRHAHAVERYIKLAECAGATVGDSLRWPIPTGDPLPRFDDYPPFILLHPFARGGGKSLSTALIQEFCRAFSPSRVVTVGQSQHKIEPRFVVSVDSGPMHIAAAVTDNLLSIHTWTDPRLVGPYNPDAWVWKNGQLFRVSELGAAKIKRRGRRFKPKDVLAVAELIRPLVPVDPMLA